MNLNFNFLKIKKTFRKGGLHSNPDVFWNILQALAFCLIIASFVFGFYLFRKINAGLTASGENTTGQTTAISKERIDKTLDYFANKEKKSTDIMNSPSPVVDPSM